MSFDADLIILGGGCAGLSLGVQLAHAGASRFRTIIVERREQYTNDRTWCFWRADSHPFESLVRHSWASMRVRSAHGETISSCGQTPYQMLSSDDFYQSAIQSISDTAAVALALGVRVEGMPTPITGGWAVHTSHGVLRARRIIDTRPPHGARADDAMLWQSFVGDEIECSTPVFDPTVVELMDFAEPCSDGVAFTYVLPVSETRALIEYTVFGRTPLSAQQLASAQHRAILRYSRGADVRTGRREHGVLPMGLTSPRLAPGANYSYAGLMSGAGRPSTGYAFQRIQRWATRAAASIHGRGGALEHVPDALHQRAMDRLFLQVLREHPHRGPELFFAMFCRVKPARIIRFLSDHATALDYAAVIAALPVGLFVSQLLKQSAPRAMTLGWNP